jgi:beta-lactamase regulating signal transducer with metallopeptidase domain
MIALGIQLGWLALRVTAVALPACVLAIWTRRRQARSTVLVLAGILAIFLAQSAAALWPMPDSWSPLAAAASEPQRPIATGLPSAATDPEDASHSSNQGQGGFALSQLAEWLGKLNRVPQSTAWQCVWQLTAAIYTVAVSIACGRLLAGWLAIRVLRRRSRKLDDPDLCQLVASLQTLLGCQRRVELRECDEPGLAATVGWHRPVIFLPREWRGWTASERQAVLAHELAHVRHGDYLLGLLTRLCQIVHFYHPLVRWLASRLRWQQEVAADLLAAAAAGGRDSYTKSLARLALGSPARMPAGALAWSALSGAAVLRRIHMLRQKQEPPRPLTRNMRRASIAVLGGLAVLLATVAAPVRLPGSDLAKEPAAQHEPFELGYLPAEAKGFVAVRPALCFQQPGMDAFCQIIEASVKHNLKELGIHWPDVLSLPNVAQIVTDVHITTGDVVPKKVYAAGNGPAKPGSRSMMLGMSSLLIRLNQDFDWMPFFKRLFEDLKPISSKDDAWKNVFEDIQEVSEDSPSGVKLYRLGVIPLLGPGELYLYSPDPRTVVFCRMKVEETRKLIRKAPAARQRDWGTGLTDSNRAAFAVVLDNQKRYYTEILGKDLEKKDKRVLDDIRFAALAVELGEGRPVRLVVDARSPAAVVRLRTAFDGYARLLQERLDADEPLDTDAEDQMGMLLLKMIQELLDSRQLRQQDSRLEWLGYSTVRLHQLVGVSFEQK